MTLKNWKKVKSNKQFDYYLRKEYEIGTHLTIFKEAGDARINNKNRFGFLVQAFKKGKQTRRVFKTKSQALKFAKNYMRKH